MGPPFPKMYIICILCILMQRFVLSEINIPCNVFSTVSTTPPPTSDQETNQILTQLQAQRTDLLELQIKNLKMQNKIEQVESAVKKVALELEKIHDLLRKANVETTQKIVKYPEDCKEVQGSTTGAYKIKPKLSSKPFEVLCDMDTRGGGWVYVINRFDGSQEFYLNWTDYKNGFGKLTGEFWLGLEHLYELTNSKNTELLIELEDWDGKIVYALYKDFSVGNEQEGFKIKYLSGFTGNTTDEMVYHMGSEFRSPDRDDSYGHAVLYHGPWWYISSGGYCKLTGTHFERKRGTYGTGIHWASFHGYNYSLKKAKMLIRPL